jgi:hypothetical protein
MDFAASVLGRIQYKFGDATSSGPSAGPLRFAGVTGTARTEIDDDGAKRGHTLSNDIRQHEPTAPILSITMQYGIKLELSASNSHNIKAKISVQHQLCDSTSDASSEHTATDRPTLEKVLHEPKVEQKRYRILPDWQTSYLWYDPGWPSNPPDEFHVDDEEIQIMYPAIHSVFSDWVARREAWYDPEFGHAASDQEGTADPLDDVAWEVDGFLLGCWLASQENVDSVAYEPASAVYDLRPGTLDSEFERFLRDKRTALEVAT